MKKHLLSMFALASMVFASSCTQEEIISQSTGNEVKVTFTTELRNDAKSRTVGEDTKNIDQLIFAVYDESGKNLPLLGQTLDENDLTPHPDDPNKKVATIEVVLVKGQTYSFAFWAQNAAYSAYTFNENKAEITVDYNQLANQREADAFFKGITNHKVTGTFTMDVTLKRPFAQVNFLTTKDDIVNAVKAGFNPAQSAIIVKNVARTLNLLTGEVTNLENTEVEFNFADLLLDNNNDIESTTINGVAGDWKYLATAYFLPQDKSGETKINATMKINAKDTNKATTEIVAPEITAQRNYRTNIYGNLLTSNGTFNVVIDPDFDGDHNVSTDEFTQTYTSLGAALEENKAKTDALTYNVEATQEQSSVTIEIPAGTEASSLTFNLDDLANNADITISNAEGGAYANPVVIEVPEGADLGDVTVNLPNAHVTLKQGSYTQVISTTSATTLEVGNGTTIGTLTVEQGNVHIAEGGTVGTITNSTGGTLYVLVGGEWTNMASKDANTIVIYEDTEHTIVMNDMYSVDSNNMNDLFSYIDDVINPNSGEVNVNNFTFLLKDDVTGDVTITQKRDEKITILGNGHDFNGVITVDGQSKTYTTAGLTIKDLNFAASSISADACINLGKSGDNNTRYTCNVTIDNCTFDVSGAVGIKSYTGGDKNLTVTGCTATENAHSLVQATGIDGILVENCVVNSKNGLNFNQSDNVVIDNCTADVKGYAVRFGTSKGDTGATETYSIKNSTLKSACEADDDAVIVLRVTADNSTLTIENTTLEGNPQITNGAKNAIVTIDGVTAVSTFEELTAAIINGGKIIFVNDITVDKWIMFSETKTIGNGNIITVTMNGLTIDGNGHTLTVNSIESAKNGDLLFDNASNLNIHDLTIKYADGLKGGGISLKSGVISEVNFVGGGYGIYPGDGEIKVEECTFATNADALYFEKERDNLTINGCTFNQPTEKNVVLLRGDVQFTNNTVNTGRTVNIVSGSPVVTGNNFNNVRLKVYSAATATISNNTINNLAFEDNATTYASTFTNNTMSDKAKATLDAMTKK